MDKVKELEELLERLAAEREALSRAGYEFPALYDAVEYLLRDQMPY